MSIYTKWRGAKKEGRGAKGHFTDKDNHMSLAVANDVIILIDHLINWLINPNTVINYMTDKIENLKAHNFTIVKLYTFSYDKTTNF